MPSNSWLPIALDHVSISFRRCAKDSARKDGKLKLTVRWKVGITCRGKTGCRRDPLSGVFANDSLNSSFDALKTSYVSVKSSKLRGKRKSQSFGAYNFTVLSRSNSSTENKKCPWPCEIIIRPLFVSFLSSSFWAAWQTLINDIDTFFFFLFFSPFLSGRFSFPACNIKWFFEEL